MKDQELGVSDLKSLFSGDFKLISSNKHFSGRHTFVATNDEGMLLYVTYFPKLGNRLNVDVFIKGEEINGQ